MSALPAPIDPVARLISLATNTLPSPLSRQRYGASLARFLSWLGSRPFSRESVQEYRCALSDTGSGQSNINVALSAIRLLAREAAACGLMDQAAAAQIVGVAGVPRRGTHAGRWMTREQVQKILAKPDDSLMGLRDRALLALLIGAALRRDEAARLMSANLREIDGRLCIVDLIGKGNKTRTIPLPRFAADAVRAWTAALASTMQPGGASWRDCGYILRPIDRRGKVGERLTGAGIWYIASWYGFAPHDGRRTAAGLALKGGASIRSIQAMLGHASVATTERYLEVLTGLEDPAADYLGL